MARKQKPFFTEGNVDIHYININKYPEENAKIYEDIIFAAIDYVEKNKINEVWFYDEYINLENISPAQYVTLQEQILNKLKSYALTFNI